MMCKINISNTFLYVKGSLFILKRRGLVMVTFQIIIIIIIISIIIKKEEKEV